jgi:hypothetical protein
MPPSRAARAARLGVAPRRALAREAKPGAGMRNIARGASGFSPSAGRVT